MALETTDNRKEYAGNGSTLPFSFPYYFLADEDLVVILVEDATNIETPQTLTTDYTVTGAGLEAGGTVTMIVAPPLNYTLVIYRDPSPIQDVNFVENDPAPAEVTEEALDKLTMLVQRAQERLDRSVVLSDGDISTADPTLPTPDGGKYLGWDTAGTALENKGTSGAGGGNVVGVTMLDNEVPRSDGTSGTLTQKSGLVIDDNKDATGLRDLSISRDLVATGTVTGNGFELGRTALRDITTDAQTITVSNQFVTFDTTAGALGATMPSVDSTHDGMEVSITKNTGDANAVTLTRADSDTIDGQTTYVLATYKQQVTLVYDDANTNWVVKQTGGGLIGYEVITASGTYNKNYAASRIKVTAIGAGGGGGGVAGGGGGTWAAGTGGGGGSGAVAWVENTDIGATETVTIGAAGAASAAGNNPGGAGGETSFGAHAVAGGGLGGTGNSGSTSTTSSVGANGGTATAGDLLVSGGHGGPGIKLSSSTSEAMGGYGGSPGILGAGGALGVNGDVDGNAGVSYGGGGGGAVATGGSANDAGGAGVIGVIIVEEYG